MHYGVNHLGHFYLTQLLWPKINKSEFFRIINVSSLAHTRVLGFLSEPKPDFENINFDKDYEMNLAYSRSKLYNVLFTRCLASKINPKKGLVASLHPGVVRTELMREMGTAALILKLITPIYAIFTKSAKEGCQTTLMTAFSENVQNGAYYSDCKIAKENSNVTP